MSTDLYKNSGEVLNQPREVTLTPQGGLSKAFKKMADVISCSVSGGCDSPATKFSMESPSQNNSYYLLMPTLCRR